MVRQLLAKRQEAKKGSPSSKAASLGMGCCAAIVAAFNSGQQRASVLDGWLVPWVRFLYMPYFGLCGILPRHIILVYDQP
ncbi:hypothetical protein ACFLWB_02670 [Chloroflexota bacterium]